MDERQGSQALSIGEAARRSGVHIETVRFYERIGLVAAAARTEGGHRVYRGEDVKRLTFVRRARELGFTLVQVRGLLGLAGEPEGSCAEVASLARTNLAAVRGRIADLQRLEAVLAELAARCRDGSVPRCPILEALFAERSAQTV